MLVYKTVCVWNVESKHPVFPFTKPPCISLRFKHVFFMVDKHRTETSAWFLNNIQPAIIDLWLWSSNESRPSRGIRSEYRLGDGFRSVCYYACAWCQTKYLASVTHICWRLASFKLCSDSQILFCSYCDWFCWCDRWDMFISDCHSRCNSSWAGGVHFSLECWFSFYTLMSFMLLWLRKLRNIITLKLTNYQTVSNLLRVLLCVLDTSWQ